MRTRKEIEEDESYEQEVANKYGSGMHYDRWILEVLLDIRDLLINHK